MKSSRIGIHLLSVLLLLLWGGIMLYFYASDRLATGEYLARVGWFRPMVLYAGIGLCVLGLFNLSTIGAKGADCCGPDHEHDHDHRQHDHKDCCEHDHGPHGHEPDHHHSHEHEHEHGHGQHHHEHEHASAGHEHAHGILEESGPIGRLVAILILAVPVSYAAMKSPDRFSANTAINKGVYEQNYTDTSAAKQYSRVKNEDKPSTPAPAPAKVAETAPSTAAATDAAKTKTADAPPATVVDEVKQQAGATPGGATESKSYGNFTLADLKAQVPQSPEGNFQLEVPEIYYTAGDKEVQSVLAGQPVETIAQVLPEKLNNAEGKRLRIFRLLVQCCAADARPFSIPVEFQSKAPEFKEATWVKVTGTMTYKTEGGQVVPILLAKVMTESAEPDNKMIY